MYNENMTDEVKAFVDEWMSKVVNKKKIKEWQHDEEVINAEYTIVPERTLDTIAAEIRTIDAQVYQTALLGAVRDRSKT